MVNDLKDLRPGHIIVSQGKIFKLAKVGAVTRAGQMGAMWSEVALRTVPPAFAGGALGVRLYGYETVTRFVGGDRQEYDAWCLRWEKHDFDRLAVGEGDPIPRLIDAKGLRLTKPDLIAYAVLVHGALPRDEIMRMAAALEGLPWVPTSNSDYFGSTKANSLVGTVLVQAGKIGNKHLYTLGREGEERAKRVLNAVGEGPARQAR